MKSGNPLLATISNVQAMGDGAWATALVRYDDAIRVEYHVTHGEPDDIEITKITTTKNEGERC